ncbi:MAG TPA: hypothetical protein VL918_05845 [Sphingobium sp.]|nr:hypothetical protein [Sphingobium sp.]
MSGTIDRLAFSVLDKRPAGQPLVKRMLERRLGRTFGTRRGRKVLLVYVAHRLALQQFYPFFHYAHLFRQAGIEFRAMSFDAFAKAGAVPGADAYFVQYPELMPDRALSDVLARIRQARASAPIAFFDWFAPTDLRFADAVEPYVTAYAKKALLRDRSAYLRPTKGHSHLEDHYAARFGVTASPPPEWSANGRILDRLTTAPAFWADAWYLRKIERLAEPLATGVRDIDLHVRMATKGTPWYAAMRQEAANAAAALAGNVRLSPPDMTDHRTYMNELARSRLCFSPFGYGEICWRDYEAILSGAVLVKPDMSHIECAPDIYRANETYVSVRWDMGDLREKVEAALADPEGMRRMALAAFALIKRHLGGNGIVDWTEGLLGANAEAP